MDRELAEIKSLLERDARMAVEEAFRRIQRLGPLNVEEAGEMVRQIGRMERCLRKIRNSVIPAAEVTFSDHLVRRVNRHGTAVRRPGVYVYLNGERQGFLCAPLNVFTGNQVFYFYHDLTPNGSVATGSAAFRTGSTDMRSAQRKVEEYLMLKSQGELFRQLKELE